MAFARGKFGVEYNPQPPSPEPSGLGWVLAVVVVVSLISLSWKLVRYICARASAEPPAVTAVAPSSLAVTNSVSLPSASVKSSENRPLIVRNLLMRLDDAERKRDLEMAAATIERLRSLPGSLAADLDDALARRLGVINVHRLFNGRNSQWVKTVEVKRGSNASRIAAENGSTLSSLKRLNEGVNIDKIMPGQKLFVMNHPRFNLVIHRRSRTADLSLNGKFFKRYDLEREVKAQVGAYVMPERRRSFTLGLGALFKADDRSEIDMLMPNDSPILVSEM